MVRKINQPSLGIATLCASMPEEESIVVESVLLAVTRVSTLLRDKKIGDQK
jgi:hypothetical protein